MGAWIEITRPWLEKASSRTSHPSWVRGLKSWKNKEEKKYFGRTLHGCVD